ncbi:MAG: BTAD domain-containing putative transcriptional regulator [Caldilineaceae bacterium]
MTYGTSGLTLTCFGAPQIVLGAAPVTGLSSKAVALFLYLAVTGRPQQRDRLADLLWSEFNNQQARNNLRYLLPELRKVLGDYLLITPQTIAFDHRQPYVLDCDRFRQTLTTAPDTVPTAALQAALDLYRGDFLAGFRVRHAPVFEEWVTLQQEAFHTLAIQGLYQLAERYWAQGDYTAGLVAGRRLLALDPWHEAGHRLQMQLLALDGQRGAALTQYQLFQQGLAAELAVEPEPVTAALYEQIRRGDYDKVTSDKVTPCQPVTLSPCHPVTLSPSPPLSHNLPGHLTPFFGREQEIADLYATLHQDDYRLVTLVGEGGVGKTRLALAVAQAMVDGCFWMGDLASMPQRNCQSTTGTSQFCDGVWFIPLIGLAAAPDLPEQLAVAIAQAMNFSFRETSALIPQLFAYLRNKQALLILDNFEQLEAAADFMLELLRQTTAVKLLITSRCMLNLQAEYPWPVAGLPTPNDDQAEQIPIPDLLRYSSIALFVERAQRIQRTFHLDAANQRAVCHICRLLNGLPLGIELAAAQLRLYSCDELQQMVTADALTITTTYRDMPPRHRNLAAVLEDSWRLLTAAEQQTLARLSIFQASFTAAAAVAIVETTPTMLATLCDQSLLYCIVPQRYLLHETVRQFAAAKLNQVDGLIAVATAARHGQYYLTLLCDQGRVLQGPTPQAAMTVLQQEIFSIEQAWRWAIAQEATTLLAQSALALCEFYHCTYRLEQGKALLGAALAMIQPQVDAAPAATALQSALATLLCAQGHLLIAQEAYAVCLHAAQQAVALAEANGQPALVARGRYLWGASLLNSGNDEAVSEQLTAALAVARATVPQAMVGEVMILALNKLAILAERRADYPAALAYCQSALALSRTAQATVAENRTQIILGSIYQRMGDFQNAKTCWEGALALMKQSGIQANQPDLLTNLGILCDNQGNYAAAQRYYTAALRAYRHLGDQQHQAAVLGNLGISADYVGDYAAALAYSQECYQLFQQLGLTGRLPIVLVNLGLHTHHLGDQCAAQQYGRQALAISQQINNQHWQSYAWTILGHAALALGEFAEAQAAYETAVTLARAVVVPFMTIEPLAGLVRVALAQPAARLSSEQRLAVYLEEIIAFLAQTAGDGLEEPLRVYLTCYQGLQALHDSRADALVAQAYELLQKRAAQIDDPVLRRSFLENVAAHRSLRSATQAAKGDASPFANNPSGIANPHTGGPTADWSDHAQGVGALCLPGRQRAAAHAQLAGGSA